MTELEAAASPIKKRKRVKKKRALADGGNDETVDGVLVNDDSSEPTIGEKLAALNMIEDDKSRVEEQKEPPQPAKPPSADSVHILLKQALRADDRIVLLNCLYTQDDKVISKSISQLNPSEVLKLLQSIIYVIESRGAILACALPWLRSLLLQHASGIMSQQSSLLALNSLYQLIESRVANFQSALQVSANLDLLCATVIDGEGDDDMIVPVIYEDKDESDDNESQDAMETDDDDNEEEAFDADQGITFDGASDLEESDDE